MTPDSGVAIRWAGLVTAAFVIQVAFLNQISILGVHPELMLLVAIGAGLVVGPHRGAGIGFAAGLLVDLTLHGNLGVSAFCYTLVGFLVGMTKEAILGISKPLSVLIVAASSAIGTVLYAGVSQLLGEHTFSDPRFLTIIAMVALWNAVLALPVLNLCRRTEGSRVTL